MSYSMTHTLLYLACRMDYNFIGHQENFDEDVSSLLKILNNQTDHKNEKYGPENNYQDTSTKDWYENITCEVMRLV